MSLKTTQQAVQAATDLLKKHGVETSIILAKCPDSAESVYNIQGERPYLIYTMRMAEDLCKNEIYAKNRTPPPPPSGEDWKNS